MPWVPLLATFQKQRLTLHQQARTKEKPTSFSIDRSVSTRKEVISQAKQWDTWYCQGRTVEWIHLEKQPESWPGAATGAQASPWAGPLHTLCPALLSQGWDARGCVPFPKGPPLLSACSSSSPCTWPPFQAYPCSLVPTFILLLCWNFHPGYSEPWGPMVMLSVSDNSIVTRLEVRRWTTKQGQTVSHPEY